ncbi:MAG: peroxiredoxin-like family protein [Pseudomonadota bacterium]
MALREELEANTDARREKMVSDEYDAIDRGIAELVAANTGSGAPVAGSVAPGFELADASGQPRPLAGYLADGPVVLSFYRGGWCSYCNIQLRAFQKVLDDIRAAGAELVAVSPEMPDESWSPADKLALEHPVLSDQGNATARAYGLEFIVPDWLRPLYLKLGIDLEARNGDATWCLPVPGTFVIASDGVIAATFVDPDYRNRTEPADVLAALSEI